MLAELAMKLTERSPRFKRFLWQRWYQYLAGYQRPDWGFMNYGYSRLTDDEPEPTLKAEDEPNRYSIQLYHRVASAIDLAGREVVEVGSGRGGGASYVMRYLRPAKLMGIDFSAKAVRYCQKRHDVAGLTFQQGDAEALPLESNSVDAVINVESSHCYGSMPKFLSEVKRALRPGGSFLFADLRMKGDRDRLHEQLLASGLKIEEQQVITPNVLAALKRDSARKLELIRASVPKWLLRSFEQFAATEGSATYEGFRTGEIVYLRYWLVAA